jgi:hypothetical protein
MVTGGTVLISDKMARLKPCLRCGYSLRGVASAKNCPECGLAVRISLSGNRGLEWTNPRWQRFLAFAFGVLAFGLFCKTLSSAGDWVIYGADGHLYQLSHLTLSIVVWLTTITGEVSPIACGSALCLLAKGEGRHPDESRAARRVMLSAGILILSLGLLWALGEYGLSDSIPKWGLHIIWWCLSGPWIPLIVCVLACSYASDLGKRGNSRLLATVSQLPIWPTAAGLVFWLFTIDRIIWPLRSIIWDWLFPLSMLAMLAVTLRMLLRGAREADLNWATDP